MSSNDFDVTVIGGGPSGATAAYELAQRGYKVLLLDRAGRIKPCGGAVPPQLLEDFDIPRGVLECEVNAARMISPTERAVDMPIENGFVGMVDRASFDEWLRERSVSAGVTRQNGTFVRLGASDDEGIELVYQTDNEEAGAIKHDKNEHVVRSRYLIGADGARSKVATQAIPCAALRKSVFAYHELVRLPDVPATFKDGKESVDAQRCDIVYDGKLSPDFYSWVFPHGQVVSVGTGTAVKGHSIRAAVSELRGSLGLSAAETVRTEGAPIPMKPLKRWDDGKHVLLCGDAAGTVAPASGEGIYYAMLCGRFAADAVHEAISLNNPKALRSARKRFMKKHGLVFFVLGIMQRFWYHTDVRRERFVTLCNDPDIQKLTWDSYLYKKLEYKNPMAHVRVFFKDLGHLLGIRSATG